MPKGYRPYLPDQDLLLPPSLREWVAEEHLVYFVSDVVDQLDLSAIHAVYGEPSRRMVSSAGVGARSSKGQHRCQETQTCVSPPPIGNMLETRPFTMRWLSTYSNIGIRFSSPRVAENSRGASSLAAPGPPVM